MSHLPLKPCDSSLSLVVSISVVVSAIAYFKHPFKQVAEAMVLNSYPFPLTALVYKCERYRGDGLCGH